MRKIQTTLGISLGTRLIGIAILQGDELLDWRIKSFKERWSKKKQERIISELEKIIYEYSIKSIYAKVPVPAQYSRELKILLDSIKSMALARKIKLRLVTLREILRESRMDKQELIRSLCLKYPELNKEWEREMNNLNPYYIKVIEAILLRTITK